MTRKKYTGAQARRAWPWLLISLLLALGLVSTGSTVGADELIPISTPGEPTQWSTAEVGTLVDTENLGQPSKGHPTLGSALKQLLEAHRRAGLDGAQAFATTHKMAIDDNRVQVAVVTTPEAISDVKAAVEALGAKVVGCACLIDRSAGAQKDQDTAST